MGANELAIDQVRMLCGELPTRKPAESDIQCFAGAMDVTEKDNGARDVTVWLNFTTPEAARSGGQGVAKITVGFNGADEVVLQTEDPYRGMIAGIKTGKCFASTDDTTGTA